MTFDNRSYLQYNDSVLSVSQVHKAFWKGISIAFPGFYDLIFGCLGDSFEEERARGN